MKKISILCLALLSFLFSQSQIKYLKGILQASQETPPTTSTGSGVVIVKYDMAAKTVKLYGDYAGLTSPVTMAHIHRGQADTAGPIVVDLVPSGDTTGKLTGTGTLTQPQEDSLLAGNMYANVHSSTYPAGEIRAQLTVTTGQTTFLSGSLQGAQETPPNPSKAIGSVYSLVDMATDSVFVTGDYDGLTSASNNAHVHLAAPGTAGGVLFPIYHSFATTGAVHAAVKVSAPDAATIANGGAYVNVHSTKYPAGEIRGQLLNNTGVRYLAGELSGKNETPPNSSAARGTVIVSYNTDSNFLQLAGDYQKLSDSVTVAQLVTPGVGVDSVIAITTSRDSTGTMIVLRDTITDAQEAVLLAGTAYVNVHSKAFPNGEIKTLLTPTANGQTQVFAVNLSPQQEVPPITNSTATGNALIIVDKTTGQTYTTGAFSGINSTVFKADIDRGPAGDTGSVILPLNPSYITSTKSGTFSGSGIVPQSTIDSMSDGLAYVNIYSTKFPSGAIRGQLAGLILPLKLTYFNGYRQANNVELLWETSEEVNVSRYEVEQYNITNNSWTTKGTVLPQGGSGDTKYSFEDLPNLYGNQYVMYRLKMIDKDGRITYSSLIRLNYENLKAELFIQANPVVNGTLRYTITGLSTGKKAEISVIDYTGRLVLRNTISSLINNTLEIPRLSAGMYKLVVRFDDTVLQKSFIK